MARLPYKIILAIILVATLGACATKPVPVVRQFPDIPKSLDLECGALLTIGKPEVKLSELVTTVTTNYAKFHECSAKLDAWREWYKEQKKIFNEAK